MKHIQHILTSIVLATVASTASSATVRVDFDTTLFDTRVDKGYESNIGVRYGTARDNLNVGMFSGTVATSSGIEPSVFISSTDFFVYCYDLAENINGGDQITYSVNMDGERARTLDFLGAVNYKLSLSTGIYDPYAWLNPTNGSMSAAIQLGIWESLYDTSSTWTLSAGEFQTTSGVRAATQTYLQSFIDVLDVSEALDGQYVMTLTAAGAQDMLTGARAGGSGVGDSQDVPEPASLALVGLALAGLAAGRRRKV